MSCQTKNIPETRSDILIKEVSNNDENTNTVEIQKRIKINEKKEIFYQYKKRGPRKFIFFGQRQRYKVYDHTYVITTYEDRKRNVDIDCDGNKHYGKWTTIKTYTETSRIYEAPKNST